MPHYRFSPRSKKYFVGQFVVRISYLGSCPPWVAAAKRATDENLPRVELNAPPCRDIKAPSLRILTIKEMLAQNRFYTGMFVGSILIAGNLPDRDLEMLSCLVFSFRLLLPTLDNLEFA